MICLDALVRSGGSGMSADACVALLKEVAPHIRYCFTLLFLRCVFALASAVLTSVCALCVVLRSASDSDLHLSRLVLDLISSTLIGYPTITDQV